MNPNRQQQQQQPQYGQQQQYGQQGGYGQQQQQQYQQPPPQYGQYGQQPPLQYGQYNGWNINAYEYVPGSGPVAGGSGGGDRGGLLPTNTSNSFGRGGGPMNSSPTPQHNQTYNKQYLGGQSSQHQQYQQFHHQQQQGGYYNQNYQQQQNPAYQQGRQQHNNPPPINNQIQQKPYQYNEPDHSAHSPHLVRNDQKQKQLPESSSLQEQEQQEQPEPEKKDQMKNIARVLDLASVSYNNDNETLDNWEEDPEEKKKISDEVDSNKTAPMTKNAIPTNEKSTTIEIVSTLSSAPTSEEGLVVEKQDTTSSISLTEPAEVLEGEEEDLDDEEIAAELEKLKMEECLEDDLRENINLIFIGHVDAGKSTISGNLLLQTGMVDKRTVLKYEKEAKDKNRESWWLAFILDQIEEERARGKTIEVGRAHFDTEKRSFTILDAPGHRSYVPNMIAAAAQADVGVLVISARRGEFETGFEGGGQTREHTQLAKTVGVNKLIVAVNKMDEPTVNWSKERYDDIAKKLSPFLKQCGYNLKRDVSWLPISGIAGENIAYPMTKSVCSWYEGPSLVELLDLVEGPDVCDELPLRMPIIDKYRDRGNTCVMGKIDAGIVKRGDSVMFMPGKISAEVLSINNDTREVRSARPGDNIRLVVRGVDIDNVFAGMVVCDPVRIPHAADEFVAQMFIMSLHAQKSIFSPGYQAVFHIHTAVEECIVTDIQAQLDMKTGNVSKRRPKFVRQGAVIRVRMKLDKPVVMETFKDFQQLGRFTLRDAGKTIAFGKILHIGPRQKRGTAQSPASQ